MQNLVFSIASDSTVPQHVLNLECRSPVLSLEYGLKSFGKKKATVVSGWTLLFLIIYVEIAEDQIRVNRACEMPKMA